MVGPNCAECPFNGQQKVLGEGSRVTYTERKEPDEKTGLVLIYKDEHHDNAGQYDVVTIGMAPAKEELEQGRPFVGASGQILRGTLKQMGLTDFYVTNTLLCEITTDIKTDIDKAIECCHERLLEEIVERRPKLTIALGDMPLHALADIEYTIKEVEGRVIPSKVGPLLPVTHPAYYWRRPDEFFDFIECTRSGLKFLKGEYQQAGEPTLEVVTPDTLGDTLNKLDRHDWLAVDMETTGFFAYGWEPDKILEMGISGDHNHAYIVPKELVPEFKQLLEEKKCIFHNAQFDCAFLKQIGITPNTQYDTMLAHYTIDERPYSHGLKRIARIYLGCDDWERDIDEYIPKRKKKSVSYSVIPTEARYKYLAKDVTRTYQLYEVLDSEVNKKVFDRLIMPACKMFIEIEHRGMRIDPVKMMDMDKVLEEDSEALGNEIDELAGEHLNPSSYTQVGSLLYEKLGYPIDPYFGGSTSKGALASYIGDPLIDKIIEYRELSKMKGTYVEGFAKFVDRSYRIHPSFKLHSAVTGRVHTENPAIMNIKKDSKLKEMFLPDIDQVLLYGDISGNELRWYGIRSGDEVILKNFREGYESYKRGDPQEVQDRYDTHFQVGLIAAGGDEVRARDELFRGAVKAGVFGRIYQRTRASMVKQFGEEVVDAMMEAISSSVPGTKTYYKMIMDEVKQKGYLESYFGRRRRFPLITQANRKEVEKQAVNFPIQSPGTDLMLLCMLHLWELKDKWGIWPFWPVHDSITMNSPSPDIMPEVRRELEEYSLEVVSGIVPFIWKMDWGINWAMQKP